MAIKTKSLLSWLYLLILIGYPYCAVLSAIVPPLESYPAYLYRSVILAISILLIGIGLRAPRISLPHLMLIGLFFGYFLRLFIDWVGLASPVILQMLIFFLSTVFVPSVAIILNRHVRLEHMGFLKKMMCASSTLVLLLLIMWSLGYGFNPWDGVMETDRFGLKGLNPISMGFYSAVCIVSCLFYYESHFRTALGSIFAGLGISSAVTLIFLANSRGPIFALLITMLLIYRPTSLKSLRTLFLVGILTAIVIFTTAFAEPIISRISNLVSGELDLSAIERLENQAMALELVAKNPVFGGSSILPGAELGDHPHNILLEITMSMGILGLIFFCAVCIVAFFNFRFSDKASSTFVFALFVNSAALSMVSGSIAQSGIFFLLLMTLLGLKRMGGKPIILMPRP